jgi:enterochelin esterase-like enzyme
VTIYLPPGYDAARDYSTLYTADGSAWVDYIGLPTILDNLIAAGAIEPVVAVLIDAAADRSAWYHFNADYLEYLKRVVTYVDDHYATRERATLLFRALYQRSYASPREPAGVVECWHHEGSIHSETQTLEAYFKRAGIPSQAVYLHQGHSFGAWRESAIEMLRYFFTSPR